MKKVLLSILVVFSIFLQYRLWIDKEGFRMFRELQQLVKIEKTANQTLVLRNNQFDLQVRALKHEPDALEEHARLELGMIKKGETFYVVVEQ
jgi:cell division protein FtsB